GVRNSVVLSAYSARTEDPPGSIFLLVSGSQDVEQTGSALTFTHQITTASSANVTLGFGRTRGLGDNTGINSKQTSVRFQFTRQLTVKTAAFVGARLQRFVETTSPTAAEEAPRKERAAFAGLSHRF